MFGERIALIRAPTHAGRSITMENFQCRNLGEPERGRALKFLRQIVSSSAPKLL